MNPIHSQQEEFSEAQAMEPETTQAGVSSSEAGSPVPGISRNVFILGITSFLTDLSSEIVYPLVPLF